MFNTLRHVLPTGKAWRVTVDKTLRKFFVGLTNAQQDFKDNFDDVADDLYPATTRRISEYETMFGLYPSDLSLQERRDRVDGAWKAQGGQSPRYIQDTLRAAGFDVYVFDPFYEQGIGYELGQSDAELGDTDFELGVPTEFTVRDPFDVLADDAELNFSAVADGATSISNNVNDVSGARSGATGRLLVNLPEQQNYVIPADQTKWPFIMYIGGDPWGVKANIPAGRRNEFEALCLKICPAHLWIGVIVEYA